MNSIDVDTILISLVVVLIIVVIARIAIQRYRMKHIKLPANVREVGAKPADASDVKEKSPLKTETQTEDLQDVEKRHEAEDDEAAELERQLAAEEENAGLDSEPESEKEDVTGQEPVLENEKTGENAPNKLDSEIDYQKLVSDPISILSNTDLSTNYRVSAIREIAYQELHEAVPQLIAALYDADASVALVAAECLGSMGDPRAIEPLMEISQKNGAEISKTVEEQIGGALVVVENETQATTNNGENTEKPDSAPYNFKEMVVFKPDQMPLDYFQPDGSPIPRKELVIKGLKDSNEQMRQMAAKAAIGIEEDSDVIEPLSKTLENSLEAEAVRAMAAEALGGMNSKESVTALIKALKDENVAVRYAASAALSGRSEPRVVEALIGATRDSDKYVRASAAYALGTTSAPVALKALIKCAEDENEAVRFSAVKSISSYQLEDVLKRLDNEKSGLETRRQIHARIEILSQFKDERAINILKKYLEDPDTEICYKASMALMGHENPELVDELINASKRLDAELYKIAKEKLSPEVFAEITKYNDAGKDFRKSFKSDVSDEAYSDSQDIAFSEKDSNTNEENNNEPANGNVPPSRSKAIQNAADFVKAKNNKKEETVLNINPDDYSGEINLNFDDNSYIEDSRKDANRGFGNEELDNLKPKEEMVVQLDGDYSNQAAFVEQEFFNNDNFNGDDSNRQLDNTVNIDVDFVEQQPDYSPESKEAEPNYTVTGSSFGIQPGFSEEFQPLDSSMIEEIIDEDDVPLEKMAGLSLEFEKIRKKLLDISATVRGSAANALGNYPEAPESLRLLRAAIKDRNELVRVSVINSLGKIANMEALELILTCEKDISTEVRYAVVKALADIPDYSAGEALKRMAQSDISIDVKRNARIALERQGA